ncbi:hypothetical protein [Novosphingobium taihuense]|uniref:Uncharacterized protein n=1 Tax=Novosphingobium taihuense TaxID=260085 RepID=A0A7W7AET9_9SPHN|nr:hypothetical protein [Novosphingobium taihuense]MBB4615733.1 hypothetical protein [Novosphingobium taihuense]TWH80146.1 hypothetical protein IQ25_03830 [Novosphingobium taihuense]
MPSPRPFRIIAMAALLGMMAACGSSEEEKPGGVTQDEAKALDAAADMLDKRELPALPEATVPAQEAPAPSAS